MGVFGEEDAVTNVEGESSAGPMKEYRIGQSLTADVDGWAQVCGVMMSAGAHFLREVGVVVLSSRIVGVVVVVVVVVVDTVTAVIVAVLSRL